MLSELLAIGGMLLAPVMATGNTVDSDTPFPVVASTTIEIRVDIGIDRARGQALRRATVLTPSGAVPATLIRTRRVCEKLCGDDEQECHFEAVLRPSRAVREPLGVLPGSATITDAAPLTIGPAQPVGPARQWLDAGPIEKIEGEDTVQWTQFPDGVYLASKLSGRDFYAPGIALNTCTQHSIASFTMLKCENSKLLYEREQGLAASFDDYGDSNVLPLLRFQLAGKEAVLIRLGLKAYTTVALLVKEDGKWRLNVWSADYATIC